MEKTSKIDMHLKNKRILITGVAGFIGSNLAVQLLNKFEGLEIIGIDNLNDYYSVELKKARLNEIKKYSNFSFFKGDIAEKKFLEKIFCDFNPQIVINMAAQAGVRYSITNPDIYIKSNIIGFYNILELCRHSYDDDSSGVEHLVYASSSSVYGSNSKIPYSTNDKTDSPVSLYAATKKSNEMLASAYSKLYNIPSTGLRFFTVYGPAGRPDMAYYDFTNKLREGKIIKLYNYGKCERDFTYIDDVIEGVIRVISKPPIKKKGIDGLPDPPHRIYNLGNSKPETLLNFVNILQEELINAGVLPENFDFDSHKELIPMQPGDVIATYADISDFERDFSFKPFTDLRNGLKNFAEWYKLYYG